MSSSNNRTFMQKHGLKIVGVVVVLTVIIALIVIFIKNGEEEGNLGSGPSESGPSAYDLSPAAQDGVNFLQDTDQSDIDGAMGNEPPASGVETYMIVSGNKPPLDYTRITSSSSW